MRYLYLLLFEILITSSFSSCVITDADNPVTISGTITDSYGQGLPEVSIQIDASSGSESTQTDTNGKYSVTIPSGGTATLTLSKEKFTTQKKIISFLGGEHKNIDLKMNTLVEDSYFILNNNYISVLKMKGEIFTSINTNMTYDVTCDADWIKCSKSSSMITVNYDTNFTFERRNAIIKITTEYGKIYNLTISQEAGPPFLLNDYLGKDGNSNFYTSIPFLSFSNNVQLTSVKCSVSGLDISTEYSADKRTVYFPNFKIPAFIPATISYTAESPIQEKIEGQIDIKPYVNCINTTSNVYQKVFYTKDGLYCWIYTYISGASSLIKYSCNDLSIAENITWDQDKYNTVSYNKYNNCLYVSEKGNSKIALFDVNTGLFIKELDLSSILNGVTINDIEFAENGYGLTLINNLLYYINSFKDNEFGLFANDPSLVDPSNPTKLIIKTIATCNGGKTFVLTDKNAEINNVFTIDENGRNMTSYYNLRGYYYCTSNNYPGIILGSSKSITYIDFSTGLKYEVSSDFTGNKASILSTGNQFPTILTSILSSISVKDGIQKKFELSSSVSNIYPSDDGKTLIITYNNKIYLFNQKVFTDYNNKIK